MTNSATRAIEIKATIPSGGTTSNAIKVAPGRVTGVRFPSAMTGNAISFSTCSTEIGTFSPVYQTASPYSITKTNDVIKIVDESVANTFNEYIKIVSNGTEGADRDIYITLRDTMA